MHYILVSYSVIFSALYSVDNNECVQQGVTNIWIFEYNQIFFKANIRLYHIPNILYTNIFGYSFVSFLIQIYLDIHLYRSWYKYIQTNAPERANNKSNCVHTQINIQKITFPFLCQLCFNFMLYHKSKIWHTKKQVKSQYMLNPSVKCQ